jgi:hypothetical protein
MNKKLLRLAQRNLNDWLTKCREETVSVDRKLELIMFSLSDICTALGTDGTQDDIDKWYEFDPGVGDK